MASVKPSFPPSMSGLFAAPVNEDDPLGVGVQARGMAAARQSQLQGNPAFASGPLLDPRWEGLFQALAEQHVSRVGIDAARPNAGANAGPQGDIQAPYPGDQIEGGPLMQSTNLAGAPASLQGLTRAAQKKKKVTVS